MPNCLTLKKSNCKNCYKCIRNCPVKSIRFSGNQAHIIGNECILCGRCFVVCPQNAKEIVDETEKVKVLIQSGDPVVVSLAPSFVANYEGVGIEAMREALKKLGFYDAEETALGATLVKREYDRILREENRDLLESIGLIVESFGSHEAAVRTVPVVLGTAETDDGNGQEVVGRGLAKGLAHILQYIQAQDNRQTCGCEDGHHGIHQHDENLAPGRPRRGTGTLGRRAGRTADCD